MGKPILRRPPIRAVRRAAKAAAPARWAPVAAAPVLRKVVPVLVLAAVLVAPLVVVPAPVAELVAVPVVAVAVAAPAKPPNYRNEGAGSTGPFCFRASPPPLNISFATLRFRRQAEACDGVQGCER